MDAKALIVLLVLPGALTSPSFWGSSFAQRAGSPSCSTLCTASSKFEYEVGKSYEYEYNVLTTTSMHGASEGAAKVNVKATVHMDVQDKCEMLLTLSDISFRQSIPNSPWLRDVDLSDYERLLTKNSLRFSFQDGKIEDLCPAFSEDKKALNFKRGVLSAFQNSMNQHDKDENTQETDVSGSCPTDYSVTQKGWTSSKIKKTKDFLGCTDRNSFLTSIQSTPFQLPNAMQSLPLLKGDHSCEHELSSKGYLVASTCTESLVFRPFSKKESGARTWTKQTLTFKKIYNKVISKPESVSRRTDLLFEHENKPSSDDLTTYAVKEKLGELCRKSITDVSADVPHLFTELVYLLRGLNSEQIMEVWERAHRGRICVDTRGKTVKFFKDALPMTGTSSSVEVMVEMLLANEVKDTQADLWLTSFTFIPEPTADMIRQLRRLLQSKDHQKEALLPTTSLINNFCRTRGGCKESQDVASVVSEISRFLGGNCDGSEQDLILTTLRAVGNIGYANSLDTALEKCVRQDKLSLNIRVLAAQAYRGLTCEAQRDILMETFLKTEEDSELRITAYLSAMQCADEEMIHQIHLALEKEEVNQVGSFVWSHLTNLMETASLHKQNIKAILEDLHLKSEYDLDKRKYSRNYELSYFSEKFGTGVMAESNMIWSSQSFIPRSGMLNLTVDVFGQSLNLLEVGGRVEGIESLIHSYISGQSEQQNEEKHTKNSQKCGSKDKLDSMKNKLGSEKPSLTASLYIRMMGNELGFKHFNENDLKSMRKKLNMKELMSELAEGHDISLSKSVMFMDTSLAVPTISGMTLRLSINGTTSVELTSSGKLDLRTLSLNKMEASFSVRPSGAVEFSGMMTLDAGITKAGLRMTTTMHTSTALSGSLDLTNGQVLSIELDTPKDKLQIFDIKSEFFIIHNKNEEKQAMLQNALVEKRRCSSAEAVKYTGYEICGDLSFINSSTVKDAPYFPFSGPLTASFVIQKKDIPRGLKFTGKYIRNDNTATAHLSINTPGSLENRGITVAYFVDKKAKSLEAEFSSRWKKVMAKGQYKGDDSLTGQKLLTATLMDDGQEYKLLAQLDAQKNKNEKTWKSNFEISRPNNPKIPRRLNKITGEGNLQMKGTETISASVNLNAGKNDAELTLDFVNKAKQKSLSVSTTIDKVNTYKGTVQILNNISGKKIKSGKIEPTISLSIPKWRVLHLDGVINFRQERALSGRLELKMDKTMKKPAKLDFRITRQSKGNTVRVKSQYRLLSDMAVIKGKGSSQSVKATEKKGPVMTSKMNIDYTLPLLANKKMRKNKVALNIKYHDRSTKNLEKYDMSLLMENAKYPDVNFLTKGEFSHKDAFTKSSVTLSHGPRAKSQKETNKKLTLGFDVNHKITSNSALITYDTVVIYPENKVEYQITGKHEHDLKKKFSFENYNSVVYGKGKSVELRLNGFDKSGKNLNTLGLIELTYPDIEVEGRKIEGRRYQISTSLSQDNSKEYTHTLNLQMQKHKHSLVTKYKPLKKDGFTFRSVLDVGDSPIKCDIDIKKIAANLEGKFELSLNDGSYTGEFDSKLTNPRYRKTLWDVKTPEREVKGSLEGGMDRKMFKSKLESYYDFGRDPSQKIEIDMNYLVPTNYDKDNMASDFGLLIKTPFEGYTLFQLNRKTEILRKEVTEEMKVIWAEKENEISSSFWMKLPVGFENLKLKYDLVVPLESFNKFKLDIDHSLNKRRSISTSVFSQINDKDLNIQLSGENLSDIVKNIVRGSLKITSRSLQPVRNILLTLAHNDDGHTYRTEASYERNGFHYKTEFDMIYTRIKWQPKVDASIHIRVPNEAPISLKLKHSNSLTNLNSSLLWNWKGGKDITIKVGGKFSKAEKNYELDLFYNGYTDVIHDIDMRLRANYMGKHMASGKIIVNQDPKLTYSSFYHFDNREFKYEYRSTRLLVTTESNYSNYPYAAIVQILRTKENKATEKYFMEASLEKENSNKHTLVVKLTTPFDNARNIMTRAFLTKIKREWELDATISLDIRKSITIKSNIDPTSWDKLTLDISTPFKEMSTLKFSFDKLLSNKKIDLKSFVLIHPVFQGVNIEFSTNFETDYKSRLYLGLPDTKFSYIEVTSLATIKKKSAKGDVKFSYGGKDIDIQYKTKFNKQNFPSNSKLIIDLSTPYELLPHLGIWTHLDKKKEKWVGDLNIKSTSKHFEFLNLGVQHENSRDIFHTDVQLESSLFEKVESALHLDLGKTAGANFTLRAESVGKTMVGFQKKTESWTNFHNKIFFESELNDVSLDADIGFVHDKDKTNAWILVEHPFDEKKYININIHREGINPKDFDIGGILQIGKYARPYNVSVQYSDTDKKKALGSTLKTPHTKPLSFLAKYDKLSNQDKTILYAEFGKILLVDYKLSSSLVLNTKAESYYVNDVQEYVKFKDYEFKFGHKMHIDWAKDSLNCFYSAYCNEHKGDIRFALQGPGSHEGDYSIDSTLNLPFEGYKDIEIEGEMFRSLNALTGGFEISCHKKESKLKFDIKSEPGNRITAEVELHLPLKDYQKNTLTYSHTKNYNLYSASAEIITGKGEHLNAKIEFRDRSDFELKLLGPIESFESFELSGKYYEHKVKTTGKAILKLAQYSKESSLTFNITPLTKTSPARVDVKLRSPMNNIRQVDLIVTHYGNQLHKRIDNYITLKSEVFGQIKTHVNWKYTSKYEISSHHTFESDIKDFRNLEFTFNTKRVGEQQRSFIEAKWNETDKISINNTWTISDDSSIWSISTNNDIATSFPQMKTMTANFDHSHSRDEMSFKDNILLRTNGLTKIDCDWKYSTDDKHEFYVTMRAPKPAELELEFGNDNGLFEGDLKLNWDKRKSESNIHLKTTLKDQSDSTYKDKAVIIRLIHPVRIMGAELVYKCDNKDFLSSGLFTWDESKGNTFSYDFSWSNLTARYSKHYSGYGKIGVPHRSVKVEGSFTDKGSSVSTQTAVLWDADRDESKKVILMASQETQNKIQRTNVNLNLPSINKQLNMGVINKEGYGSNLLDSEAEISYSSDPRKTITLSTKLTDEHYDKQGEYNYSLTIRVEHPITDTDLKIMSHIGFVNKVCSGGQQLSFVDIRRDTKVVSWLWNLDTKTSKGFIQASTPLKALGVEGEIQTLHGKRYVTVKTSEDGNNALHFRAVSDPKRRSLDIDFNYDSDDKTKLLTLNGQYLTDSSIKMDVVSHYDRQTVSETMAAVKLNSSNVLHTRIEWRPEMFYDIQKFLGTKLTTFSYAADQAFKQTVSSIGNEVKAKHEQISLEVDSEMTQVFDLMEKEMHTFSEQLDELKTKARRFYQRNDLHIQDLGDSLKSAIDSTLEAIRLSAKNYRHYYTQVVQTGNDWLNSLKSYPIENAYKSLMQEIVQGILETRVMMEEAVEVLAKELQKLSQLSYKKYLEISRSIERKLNSYEQSMLNLPIYQRMIQERRALSEKVPGFADTLQEVYVHGQQVLQDQFHDMMTRDEFKYAHAMANEVHQQIMHWQAEGTLTNGMKRLAEMTKNLLLMEAAKLKSYLLDLKKSRVIVYNPEKGELEFELYLPLEMKSLSEPPKLNVHKYVKEFKSWSERKLPSGNQSIWDMYYDHVPPLHQEHWIPPFSATGYLLGVQEIITFDGSHYSFSSSCSHVLVRDIVNDDFNIVLNFDKRRVNGIKSMCVTLKQTDTITISKDYKIELNSMEIEMPYQSDTLKIRRVGDEIKLSMQNALDLTFNPKIELYKVKVSGWYHGRTAGLLGRFNNEIHDEKNIVHETKNFEVKNGYCNNKNKAMKATSDKSGLCEALFSNNESKFRPCFKQVASSTFMEICQIYMSTKSVDEARYFSSEQYISVCQDKAVYMTHLKDTVHPSCESGASYETDGSNPSHQSADVVFVMEDSLCNSWAKTSLPSMVNQLDKALKLSGLQENRFGLVGYDENEATVRTTDGNHFGKSAGFLKALETFSFKESIIPGEVFYAVDLLMKYPFRPGVAKVAVIAPCSDCDAGVYRSYYDSLLQNQGFTVHVLMEMNYQPMDELSKRMNVDIYGVDKEKVYTNNVYKKVKPVASFSPNIDGCDTLAESTNGSVFDTSKFTENQASKKGLITSFVQRVGLQQKVPACQKCSCDTRTGLTKCEACSPNSYLSYLSPHIPSLPKVVGDIRDVGYSFKNQFF